MEKNKKIPFTVGENNCHYRDQFRIIKAIEQKINLLDVTGISELLWIWRFFKNQVISPLNNKEKEKYIEYVMKNLYAKNHPHNTII